MRCHSIDPSTMKRQFVVISRAKQSSFCRTRLCLCSYVPQGFLWALLAFPLAKGLSRDSPLLIVFSGLRVSIRWVKTVRISSPPPPASLNLSLLLSLAGREGNILICFPHHYLTPCLTHRVFSRFSTPFTSLLPVGISCSLHLRRHLKVSPGKHQRLHRVMESIGSGYSGSPESKSTLDTPENGPYDNFFSLTTPSDLRLSLSDDSYAEWKALPSRLLESPPPQLSTIQFRKNMGGLAGGSNDLDGHDLFGVDEPLRNQHSSPVNTTEGNLVQRTESSSPHAAVGRHNPECNNTERKSHHSPHGLKDESSISNCILQDRNPETIESSTTSTRHLKICNIAPTTSLVVLYELLQVGLPLVCAGLGIIFEF